jgi:hypothetical protein
VSTFRARYYARYPAQTYEDDRPEQPVGKKGAIPDCIAKIVL